MIIVVSIGVFFATVQELVYLRYNKKVLKEYRQQGGEKPWLYTP
jgi:hypothetical protein